MFRYVRDKLDAWDRVGGENFRVCARVCVRLLQSRLTLCDPMDCNWPGSCVHEILQARILEGVAMPSSRGSSQPRDQPVSPALAGGFFTANGA